MKNNTYVVKSNDKSQMTKILIFSLNFLKSLTGNKDPDPGNKLIMDPPPDPDPQHRSLYCISTWNVT
jgi:hypothetical protein